MTGRLDIAALKASAPSLAQVVGASTKLTKVGGEWRGCCPLHDDRSPSFFIYEGGQRWVCFGGCGGGDVLDFVRASSGLGLRDAAAMLSGGELPVAEGYRHACNASRRDDADKIAFARKVWGGAVSASGTPADFYWRARGLSLPLPASMRFARLKHPDTDQRHPCAVFGLIGPDEAVQAVQRVYLLDDGSDRLRDVTGKLSLGVVRGAAVRFGDDGGGHIAIAEGPESAASAVQLGAVEAWATCGVGNMHRLVLPGRVRRVTICGERGPAGEAGTHKAAQAYADQGREVSILWPAAGCSDLNDELMKGARA